VANGSVPPLADVSAQMVRHAGSGSYVDGNVLMLRVRHSGFRS